MSKTITNNDKNVKNDKNMTKSAKNDKNFKKCQTNDKNWQKKTQWTQQMTKMTKCHKKQIIKNDQTNVKQNDNNDKND
jgi:hypothetical protein